uniref:hypothetical protein n=1 Tax=Halorubrum distributum TaxID=29283 RepID=UPI001EF9E204|nr:hypothetical protein [Halorubrum litoreum]
MPLREVSKFPENIELIRAASLFTTEFIKPISTVSKDQLAIDEKMIRLHGQQF